MLLEIDLAGEEGENVNIEIQHQRISNPVHLVGDVGQERLSIILFEVKRRTRYVRTKGGGC